MKAVSTEALTKLIYGAVSLEDGRKQEDYIEIEEPEE